MQRWFCGGIASWNQWIKFRRQHPIGIYIADFYCHKLKLVIEVDGSIHSKKEVKDFDVQREKDLTDWGYTVVRFSNQKVLTEMESVLDEINSFVDNLTTSSTNILK